MFFNLNKEIRIEEFKTYTIRKNKYSFVYMYMFMLKLNKSYLSHNLLFSLIILPNIQDEVYIHKRLLQYNLNFFRSLE